MLKRCAAVLTACLLACLLSGCFLLPQEASVPELPLVTPFSGADYVTANVTRGDLELYAKVTLTYYPTRREDLKFGVPDRSYGVVYASAGEAVQAGELVAELDSTAEAEALRQTEQELQRLYIQLESARTALALAQEEEALTGDRSHVTSEARQADITYYLACIDIQERQRAEQRAELEQLRLYAPIDGTVTYAKTVAEGSRSSRTETVVSIADSTSSVFTGMTENWALFPAGAEYTVTTSTAEYFCIARDPADFGLSEEPDSGGRRIVVLEITEGQQAPAGSSVKGEVQLLLEKREDVLLLPSRAIFTVGEKSYVYHEDETGFKTAHEVECGLNNGSWVEITGGLGEGEEIIVG